MAQRAGQAPGGFPPSCLACYETTRTHSAAKPRCPGLATRPPHRTLSTSVGLPTSTPTVPAVSAAAILTRMEVWPASWCSCSA